MIRSRSRVAAWGAVVCTLSALLFVGCLLPTSSYRPASPPDPGRPIDPGGVVPPPDVVKVDASGGTLRFNKGQVIGATASGVYLKLQTDNNLVLYGPNGPLWATGTNRCDVTQFVVQTDGNFVLYAAPGRPIWATGTNGPNRSLWIHGNGEMAIYGPAGDQGPKLWSSGTAGMRQVIGPAAADTC